MDAAAAPRPARRPSTARPARGLSLVETLVTLLVLAAGLAAYVRVQGLLWRGAELARQRTEALHLAREDLERLRGHAHLAAAAGSPAWDEIGERADTPVDDRSTATVYTLGRRTATVAAPPLKTATAQVAWTDRHGQAQQLALTTLLAGLDPRWAGWATLAPQARGAAQPLRRHPAIPLQARDLGDGRSAFKPRADVAWAWVFDHASGRVAQRCEAPAGVTSAALTAADLGACVALDGLLLSGTVRFATAGVTLTAADAIEPAGPALDLDLALTLTSRGHPTPAWECLDDAPATPGAQTAVRYWCVVRPAGTPPRWSGRLDLQPRGWTLAAAGADAYAVCRYSADHDRDGRIGNAEHPAAYAGVDGVLAQQNFLVVRADAACPVETAPPGVDHSTVRHQP